MSTNVDPPSSECSEHQIPAHQARQALRYREAQPRAFARSQPGLGLRTHLEGEARSRSGIPGPESSTAKVVNPPCRSTYSATCGLRELDRVSQKIDEDLPDLGASPTSHSGRSLGDLEQTKTLRFGAGLQHA